MCSDCVRTKIGVNRHRLPVNLLALTLAALFFSGCSGATGPGNVATTGLGSVSTTSSGSSTFSGLTATPSAISFGSVNTGTTSTQSVTLNNAGAAPLSVSKVSISGAGFNASGVPTGLTIAPGQTATLSVTFAPSSTGSVAGNVSVAESTSPSPLAVSLSGTGVTPNGHSVTLTWNSSTSSVVGYRTYRATTSSGPFSALNSSPISQLQWKDSTVQPGTTYYYVVTAVASNNAESIYSNQASAAIPKP